jgi:hypothetical protein
LSQSAQRLERAHHISTLAATVVTADDGGPIRTITAVSLRRPSGRFPSRKALRTLPFDAMHERDMLWISEADPAVVTFLSQPHRLELNVHGKNRPLIYFPDLRRDMEDGAVEIIETKKHASEVDADPLYAQKIELARQVYAMLGWHFRIMDWPTIKRGSVLSNARMIAGSHHVKLTTKDRMQLLSLLQFRAIPYSEVITGMSDTADPFDIVAREKLHAAIVHRVARLDIDRPIYPTIPVQIGPAALTN